MDVISGGRPEDGVYSCVESGTRHTEPTLHNSHTHLSVGINDSQDDGRRPVSGRFYEPAVGRSQAGGWGVGGGAGVGFGHTTRQLY